ncbi:MAG: class I SAM-dependent methyltransferase [Saprospiraceae bacterium]|nr:class I SAM-dependent methyltransferase [Saprospiraceae bacterium]
MLESFMEFTKFYSSAISKYRVHSPFVTDVIEEVIYGSKVPSNQERLEDIRQTFLQNHRKISLSTLGAPSRVSGSATRSIRQIAKSSLTPRSQAELLFRIVDYFRPTTMLELGTCLGVTSLYQYAGNQHAIFHTVEGDPETFAEAKKLFESIQHPGLKAIQGRFADVLPSLLQNLKKVDYAFIDGDHTGEGLRRYLKILLPYIHDSSVIVLHDIHWSSDMAKAWCELRKYPDIKVSIDLFYLGLLFFRKEIDEPIHINLVSHWYKPWQNGFFH